MAKWWNQARTIDELRREVAFEKWRADHLEALLDKAEAQNEPLKAAAEKARISENKVLRQVGDAALKQLKLSPVFVADTKEKVEPKPDPLVEARLEELAAIQRNADLEEGFNDVQDLDWYKDQLRTDPNAVFI